MWHRDHYSCQQCHLRFNPFPSALSSAHPQPTRPGGAARHPTRSIPGANYFHKLPSPTPNSASGVLFPILGNCQANTANNNSTRDRKYCLIQAVLCKMGWGEKFLSSPRIQLTLLACKSVALPSSPLPPRFPTLSPKEHRPTKMT